MYSSGALLQSERHYQSTQALSVLRPAGVTQAITETAKDALTWDDRPQTPAQLKPFQHYARQPPGTITRHFGSAKDAVPQDRVFGCKTKASQESAADCIACYPDSEIRRWKLEQSEAVYARSRQEPLGHSPTRNYNMPEGMGSSIPFGRPLHVREQEAQNSTQKIIFPPRASADDSDNSTTHRMYLTSHQSWAPGEQRNREYDWSKAGIDPRTHRFGLVDTRGQKCGNVKQVLQPDLDEGLPQQPVVSEIYDKHKATLGDALGRPRLLGAGPGSQVPSDHVFGKPSAREREPCVCELIRGPSSAGEQLPDPGLGKSVTRWRNTREDTSRTFGLPSVRIDVPLPVNRSVANTHNYGNEPTAFQLLFPPKSVNMGVKEEHLLQARNRDELLQLLAEAGIGMDTQEFEAVFSLAAQVAGSGEEQCSLEDLMSARQKFLQQQTGL